VTFPPGPDHLSGELEAFFSDKAGVQVGVLVGVVGASSCLFPGIATIIRAMGGGAFFLDEF